MTLWFVYEVPQHLKMDPHRRQWRLLGTYEKEESARGHALWWEDMVRRHGGGRCYTHVEKM